MKNLFNNEKYKKWLRIMLPILYACTLLWVIVCAVNVFLETSIVSINTDNVHNILDKDIVYTSDDYDLSEINGYTKINPKEYAYYIIDDNNIALPMTTGDVFAMFFTYFCSFVISTLVCNMCVSLYKDNSKVVKWFVISFVTLCLSCVWVINISALMINSYISVANTLLVLLALYSLKLRKEDIKF